MEALICIVIIALVIIVPILLLIGLLIRGIVKDRIEIAIENNNMRKLQTILIINHFWISRGLRRRIDGWIADQRAGFFLENKLSE